MRDFEIEKDKLLWSVELSIIYHNHRLAFFDYCYNVGSFLTAFCGTSTLVLAVKSISPKFLIISSLFVSLFSCLTLAFGVTKKATKHYVLAREFIILQKRIIILNKDFEQLDQCKITRLGIEMDEPPELKVLYDYCYNEMLQKYGTEEGNRLKFKWYHRITRDFFDCFPSSVEVDHEYKENSISRLKEIGKPSKT